MTLPPALRKAVERAVAHARTVAEVGARAAIESLAVQRPDPWPHMGQVDRLVRRRLRAHARQLGDRRGKSGTQAIERLVQECAYEHWHGMLFARFLAENHLLIEPELGVAVTLDECEELAAEHDGAGEADADGMDKWALAARFAHAMLPQVFRPELPVREVRFAQEHRQRLEALVEGLPAEVFTASDALGWVYQFWQSQKKAEVNASEAKIGADELPAVTQLFTEPYMVAFLLDNSLGAWWAARRLTDADLNMAQSEAELRQKASIPGLPLEYLRFVRPKDGGPWRLASGSFESWPNDLGELKVLDPCCGSGHFLAAAFAMLVPMRMALEGLPADHAVDAVLRDNVHGLEIDARCVEIAVFSLAMAAWGYPGSGGYRPLPELHLACSGHPIGTPKAQWTALAADDHNLRIAMGWLYDVFKDAPTLGSLLNPAATEAASVVDWPQLSTVLADALTEGESEEQRETALAASGLAKAAALLSQHFHLVATNVPYLARRKQSQELKDFCEHHPRSKNDLATVFLERCLELCLKKGGTASLVLPQNWLFLTSYRKLRQKLLKGATWLLLARLGPGAFETIGGEVVKAGLLTLGRERPRSDGLFDAKGVRGTMCGLDVSAGYTADDKATRLATCTVGMVEQAQLLQNPDARIAIDDAASGCMLSTYATASQGVSTVDKSRFVMHFWEVALGSVWSTFQSPANTTEHYGGRCQVFRWEDGDGSLVSSGAYVRGQSAWGCRGLAIGQMQRLPATVGSGGAWDTNCALILPAREEHLPAIWCFCSSPVYNESVRRIDQQMKVTNNTLVKVPFDLDHWSALASHEYPNGLPQPYSNDATQWIFHGHPCGSVVWDGVRKRTTQGANRTASTVLQVALARLLGYRWPAEQNLDMELAAEQREWASACEPLLALADADGIVCIPSVCGERPAAERLQAVLSTAYGDDWSDSVQAGLLGSADADSLDDWLRNCFFDQHCKLFHNRPFIWHIWDGRKDDGFHALVNYHRLAASEGQGRRCLESLAYSYLGDWITRQQDALARNDPGAEDRLAAAIALQQTLDAILVGETPRDVFVRWKPLAEQPIGWEPDINDGVRLNIRPFMTADIPGGRKGAGILRAKPNIHWRKDRGKESHREQEQYPWFWRDGEFTDERVNDWHLRLDTKRAASER